MMIKEQSDWVEALPTIAWIHKLTCHASTNYEPLRFMIGCKLKLPSECRKVGTDITKIRDLTEEEPLRLMISCKPKLPSECRKVGTDITKIRDFTEEVDQILEGHMCENIEILMNVREEVFDDAASNIRAQKRQKKNYDIRHKERAEFLEIGDIVVKRILVNVNRKGGKLDKQVSDDYFVVEDFMTNRNIVLRNMETNVLEKKSVPRDYPKKIHIENEMKTNRTENMNENDDTPMETYEDMITNMNDITYDMTHNTMNNMTTNTHEIEETLNNTQTNNQIVFTSDEEDMFLDDTKMLSPS